MAVGGSFPVRHCYFRLGGAAGSPRRGLPLGVFIEDKRGRMGRPIVDGSDLGTRTRRYRSPRDRVPLEEKGEPHRTSANQA